MKQKVTYEWDMETAYNYGDIIDHHHADRLKDLKCYEGDPHEDVCDLDGSPEPAHIRLVLVRDTWREDGLDDRQWCYLNEDGMLPDTFDGGAKVPVKFRREFGANSSWAGKFIPIRDEARYAELTGS